MYFGWALLEQGSGDDTSEGPWKCVANIGYSPTFAGQENAQKIVEAHLIGYEGDDGTKCSNGVRLYHCAA